jgi:MOB kinase activator 1
LPPPPTVIEDHQQQQQSLGPIIQILPKHVLDEEHSLCPKKKHAHGTRTWKLHQYIKDSMANGLDVIDCVRLPEGCLVEEWIAVHVIDFFNEISLLFGTINEFCTVDSCAEMSAGPCYTYLWADSSHPTPVSLPATQYVTRLMHWIEAQLADTSLFPNMEQKFDTNPEFMNVSKVILKRLFRVYAHMYHNHLETFVALHAEAHLNFCFKRFICFIQEFALIEQKELNALKKLIMTLLPPSTSHNKKKTINKPFIS